ncbi:tetratricopeptide repeat protein [Parasphingorhabdus sp.]|uniref:tetratricopeptide repeat protein n=1 Tax=Parasphingorhabdus sp. TaxID=2709688 RepID=UPI003A8D05B2
MSQSLVMNMVLPMLIASAQDQSAPAEPQITVTEEVRELLNARDEIGIDAMLDALDALGRKGDDSALELLGEIYAGAAFDYERDSAKACSYFGRVTQVRPDTLHNLATCFYSGDGRPQDYTQARLLYKQAAELGYAKAKCAYGNMLIAAQGGTMDIDQGLALCRKAAETGLADAQADLAGYLLLGKVIAKDAVEARKWFLAAAEQGHANASFVLAQIYWNGDGVDKNRDEAEKWWKISYQAGRKDASFHLGNANIAKMFIYTDDKITGVDLKKMQAAREWFELAKDNANRPEQRAEAGKMLVMIEELSAKYGSQNTP